MIAIKTFKFDANLEFISSHLKEVKVPHFADFKSKTLLAEEKNKEEILKIIEDLKIDENDVPNENELIEGYKEWNENMYNPGYYTGGKSPSFNSDKNNYFAYGCISLVSGLACLVEYINSKNFSRYIFWIIFMIILLISFSMFYQHVRHKKRNSD